MTGTGQPKQARQTGPGGRLRRLNTGGMLYGTLVASAALAVGSGRGDKAGDIADAMISTLVIYWLAHVYTAVVSGRQAGSATRLRRQFRRAARHEAPILAGGLLPVVIFVALAIAHVTLDTDVLAALVAALAMFAIDGYLAGRQAGVRGWRLRVEAGSAVLFGILIALLMVSLH